MVKVRADVTQPAGENAFLLSMHIAARIGGVGDSTLQEFLVLISGPTREPDTGAFVGAILHASALPLDRASGQHAVATWIRVTCIENAT
jgi:hypothetical protein